MTEQDLREKEREIEKSLQLLFTSIHNYKQAKIEYRKNRIATISNNVIAFNKMLLLKDITGLLML